MDVILPDEIVERRDAYCSSHSLVSEGLFGFGVDGFVFRTDRQTALKVHRYEPEYRNERSVYLRLRAHNLQRLRGFQIPILINHADDSLAIELSVVTRPYILDFAAATLDTPPAEPDFDSPEWQAEKRRQFGHSWGEVQRVIEALRQYGIYFCDVHPRNIDATGL